MIAIASPPPLDRRRIKRMSGAPILTAEQMRNAEQHLFASGVPEYDVMERAGAAAANRSEEHTSELQSLMRISYAVFCLKKKKSINQHIYKLNTTTPLLLSIIPLPTKS